MSEATINRRYKLELGASIALYGVVLVASLTVGARMPQGATQTAVYLLPMLPFLLAVAAVVRHLRRVDEYIRQSALERIAIAAAVTAGWTFSYGFLENAGYPRLSMFVIWPAMGAVWGLLALTQALRERS
jgi:purine-cytosine permease-like protein